MSLYDQVLYLSRPFNQTHPGNLAALATLYGMQPAPVERCRVLELGCGDGGNLIPVASDLPESEFVGVDLAGRPVALGRELAAEAGVRNVRLLHTAIENVAPDFGKFDYVIAHGVYSWVPEAVRERLLAVCREHLAPHGVAFVSYNAMPGWHVRRMLRDMMLFHVGAAAEPRERIGRATELLDALAGAPELKDPHSLLLQHEATHTKSFHPAHLYHDDLAETNDPFYFHEFVARAARHGLRYLAEAGCGDTIVGEGPAGFADVLRLAGDDRILREQYADFLKCRRFRQTLLCREEVALAREPRPGRVKELYVSGRLEPTAPDEDLRLRSVAEFRRDGEQALATDSPLIKAAALLLGESWPRSLKFEELLKGARERIAAAGDASQTLAEDERTLCEVLLEAFGNGVVFLSGHRPRLVTRAGERPCANPVARAQLRRGPLVVNQLHLNVRVEDEMGRQLLLLLDGTRTRAELVAELAAAIESGKVDRSSLGDVEPQQVVETLRAGLEQSLAGLARGALLIA